MVNILISAGVGAFLFFTFAMSVIARKFNAAMVFYEKFRLGGRPVLNIPITLFACFYQALLGTIVGAVVGIGLRFFGII